MKNAKKMRLVSAGALALASSVFGISLLGDVAGANSGHAVHASQSSNSDPGPVVQDGPQSGVDATSEVDASEASPTVDSTEAPGSESAAASDGPGGYQDAPGNVDNASISEQ